MSIPVTSTKTSTMIITAQQGEDNTVIHMTIQEDDWSNGQDDQHHQRDRRRLRCRHREGNDCELPLGAWLHHGETDAALCSPSAAGGRMVPRLAFTG